MECVSTYGLCNAYGYIRAASSWLHVWHARTFDQIFDLIFGQRFDQGFFRESDNNSKCSVQFYPAYGRQLNEIHNQHQDISKT